MEENNQMKLLYMQFKNELREGGITEYYDEQDLVDIFDFAGDVHDDFVRTQVILVGNRLFPDSDDLKKRLAIFLSSTSNEAFSEYVQAFAPEKADVMWAILKTKALMPRGRDASNALEEILAAYRFDEDETIIQFVALARALQQDEWLVANIDRLRANCSYAPTLLFEIARMAETKEQTEKAITILEELTMTDPFNIDYWGLLAELQSNTGKFDDALVSLDYAKAVAPDDNELLSLEGYVYLRLNRPAEARKALEKSLAINPNHYIAKRNLMEAYLLDNMVDKARSIISELFYEDPGESVLMINYLQLFPEDANDILYAYYTALGSHDEQEAMQRVNEFCANNHADTALIYLNWYRNNFTLSQSGDFALLELLYLNGRYSEAYDFICNNLRNPILNANELAVIGIIASTLLRLGMYDETLTFCEAWIEKLANPVLDQRPYRLVNRGLAATLRDIATLLRSNPSPSNEEIDKIAM